MLCLLALVFFASTGSVIGQGETKDIVSAAQAPTGVSDFATDQEVATLLGTSFTYQGQLKQDGIVVDGTCDFRFVLYNTSSLLGGQVGLPQEKPAVAVSGGAFTVLLDFGATAFNGEERWLGVWVRCPAGSDSYVTLTPRQQLTPAPYAFYAAAAPWSAR